MVDIPRFGDRAGVAAGELIAYVPPGVIFTGPLPTNTKDGLLLDQNAVTVAFTIVGRITTGGKLTPCDGAATDGSEVPVGITTSELSDTGADIPCEYYFDGQFAPSALTYTGFASVAALQLAFESKCPHLVLREPASGTL